MTIVDLELRLYDREDEPQGLRTAMKMHLSALALCRVDYSTTNEAKVMQRGFAIGASRYGGAERGGVMRR